MGKIIDITGRVFGKLDVIERAGTVRGEASWLCQCVCGNRHVVGSYDLRSGHTRSCGCSVGELIGNSKIKHAHAITGKESREYKIWSGMKARCNNSSNPAWPDYGGRGIYVCSAWAQSFEQFLSDMGARPLGATLDRIDNDGPYGPGNCRWATRTEQARNRRTSRRLEWRGRTMTLVEWAEEQRINPRTLASRLHDGWPVERALSTPAKLYLAEIEGREMREAAE